MNAETPPASRLRQARVLFVCTGNICRSPIAESMLRRCVDRMRLPVSVLSAGLLPDEGPADGSAIAVLRTRGIDLAGHRRKQISAPLLDGADLILGMERLHIREVVALEPTTFSRAFTLREFVRRAAAQGPRTKTVGLRAWAAVLQRSRTPWDLLGSSAADTVDDPFGLGRDAFEQCADEIDGLIESLVALTWPRD